MQMPVSKIHHKMTEVLTLQNTNLLLSKKHVNSCNCICMHQA